MILDKRLEVFLAVAETGSFSRASRKLSLSQSVVSFHIEALERELGVSLFRRQGRTIALTREGELLYEKGRQLAQEAQLLEKTLSEHSASLPKRISLAGDALTCAFTLPWTLAAFREVYPDVLFAYQHYTDQETLVDKLVSGELDVALIGHPIRHRKLTVYECFRDEIVLVSAPERFPERIVPEDLRRLPLLWITGDRGLEMLLHQRLLEAGVPPKDLNIFMEVDDLPILKTFIRAGVGLAFLPQLTVADELRFGLLQVVAVEGLTLERMTYLVHRREGPLREVVVRFLNFIQQQRWGKGKKEIKRGAG